MFNSPDTSLAYFLSLSAIAFLSLSFLVVGALARLQQGPPTVFDSKGIQLQSAAVGQNLTLTIINGNDGDINQIFDTVMEIRNSKGVTVYLQFQTRALEPLLTSEVAFAWAPVQKDSYVIRSFTITDLNQPLILSDIVTAVFNVNRETALDYSKLPVMSMALQPPANGGVIIEWDGILGSYCWGNACADTAFIVPEEQIEIKKGSTIKFQITNNAPPDELGVIVYRTENILADQQLTTLDSGQYLVDLESGNEYILFVGASWKDGEYSAGSAVYYYKIQII